MKWEIQEPQVLGGVWGNASTVPSTVPIAFCAASSIISSHSAIAKMLSTTTTARGTMQGSCLPEITSCAFSRLRNVYRLLLLRDGWRRLHGGAEYDGHAICNAARHAAVVIARADDLPVPHAHRVVCLTAAHARKRLPSPNSTALTAGMENAS